MTRGHHGSVRTTTDPSRTPGVTGEEDGDDDDDNGCLVMLCKCGHHLQSGAYTHTNSTNSARS